MSKFKVGDRIRVYSRDSQFDGRVDALASHWLYVMLDGHVTTCTFHPKQCRKLKPKKERRRIWVNKYANDLNNYCYSSKERADSAARPTRTECVEFIEVKRKKKEKL